jgi:hypothetical protein
MQYEDVAEKIMRMNCFELSGHEVGDWNEMQGI